MAGFHARNPTMRSRYPDEPLPGGIPHHDDIFPCPGVPRAILHPVRPPTGGITRHHGRIPRQEPHHTIPIPDEPLPGGIPHHHDRISRREARRMLLPADGRPRLRVSRTILYSVRPQRAELPVTMAGFHAKEPTTRSRHPVRPLPGGISHHDDMFPCPGVPRAIRHPVRSSMGGITRHHGRIPRQEPHHAIPVPR